MDESDYVDYYDEDESNNGIFGYAGKILLGILIIGIAFGLIIFSMNLLKTEFLKINFEFSPNAKYSDLQEMFGEFIYPYLDMVGFVAVLCHLYILFLIIGFFILAYRTGTKPVYLGLSVFFLILATYLATIISNFYLDLVETPIIQEMVEPLTYYDFFMSNFPWFVFLIGVIGILISLINFQHPSVNTIKEEDLYQ